jgi:FKBP-type peptidyl-prolyl cis-trans isomerase
VHSLLAYSLGNSLEHFAEDLCEEDCCLMCICSILTGDVENAKEVVFPNNIRYVELRAGGGASPQRGDLVVVDLIGKIESTGEVFVDTSAAGNKRPLAFVFGARPYAGGMCDGLEFVLRSMKVGGKRRVIVPPELGFGETGADLSSGARIPSQSTLEYIVQLQRVSIAPS